jgi:hypothetical protein
VHGPHLPPKKTGLMPTTAMIAWHRNWKRLGTPWMKMRTIEKNKRNRSQQSKKGKKNKPKKKKKKPMRKRKENKRLKGGEV